MIPSVPRGCRSLLFALACLLCSAPSAAAGGTASGGMAAMERPEVRTLRCATGEQGRCAAGETLRIAGEHLRGARTVVFLGGRGRGDDRRARPSRATTRRVTVRVPRSARTGRVQVVSPMAGPSRPGPMLRVMTQRTTAEPSAPLAAGTGVDGVFPIAGEHEYGTATNRFGGGRGHEGQDVFAACGTPVVAARAGEVTFARWHDRAGNYVVIKAADGTSQAYMHLLEPAAVAAEQAVAAGQQIGRVGRTGRATGCHLHFELWTAPGWYEGGKPIDPLPDLQRWDAAS